MNKRAHPIVELKMPQIVYRYGLHAPHEGVEIVYEQMRLAHRYRNTLVEIERGRRAAVREVELAAGDLPAAMRQVEAAKAIEEAAYRDVARHRAASRKRDEPAALRDALRAARVAVREASQRAREIREAVKASPSVTAARDLIGERAKGLANNAYQYSGLYWGQRALTVEAAADSFASTPMYDRDWQPSDPRFERWSGDGAVALQIMGGLSVDEIHGCEDSRLHLRKPDVRAWSGARSERRRYGSTAELALRVGSDGRTPVFARWVCDMDRQLPDGARVVWATVHRRMRGPHSEWSVSLTLQVEGAYARGAAPARLGGAVAVDVGWRAIGGELRVAGWQDEHGNRGELRLSAADLAALHESEEIRSARDARFDLARMALGRVVSTLSPAPAWLAAAARGLGQWKSPARLASLCQGWPEGSHGAVLDTAYRDLCTWYYRDRHDWERETRQRVRALRRRREIYRVFAAKLAGAYDTIVVERFDKRVFAVRPQMATEEDVAQNETARSNRAVAATSDLVQSLVSAGRSRQRVVAAVSAVDTTRTCPHCGLVTDRGAEAAVVLRCECGRQWDQDVDGAPLLLLARWREQPGDAKILVGARMAENGSDVEEKKESRWVRVKRLRAEKEARMKAAREVAGTNAE